MTKGPAGTDGQAYHLLTHPRDSTCRNQADGVGLHWELAHGGAWLYPVNCICLFTRPESVTRKDQMGQAVQREPAWLRALRVGASSRTPQRPTQAPSGTEGSPQLPCPLSSGLLRHCQEPWASHLLLKKCLCEALILCHKLNNNVYLI